ncbi:hypothetical protein G6F57_012931 [Rhizopus arrhizus]|uniref:Uncharacterized protein n=1 Tax=Rhizopus oryzae TaxID=64495 RepID=A0A9P6WYE8_RHIOR|nr:hypothetical protein G6F24_012134 [Rhizopus arrhizus]KAG0781062.1 hypothetical protein G6F21_011841 [Rhizopus arrhizus]KAG0805205.1 hypothetical protein G6F20_012096 [Rhizopus arrhizus]KAG0868778.1 hypothetical protein G6F15_012090 [Rhizopus arrhizus]KAG0890500.1 hypothetical protein G6F34_012476 [Rhizopus arrhizus]
MISSKVSEFMDSIKNLLSILIWWSDIILITEFEQESSANNQENLDELEPSIGIEWLKFIKKHQSVFHPFSPAANCIIRSGNGISRRPDLDRDLYEKHMESHDVEQYTLPTVLRDHLDPAIDANNLVEFKKEIRKILALILREEERAQNENECLAFLEDFSIKQYGSAVKETPVFVDEKSQYKSDGLVKISNLKDLEILLLESSGHFSNSDKCIADEYSFASVAKFSQVKVFFLHAAETKLHMWSMRYQPDGFFDLWRELCLEIKPLFEDRIIFLPQLIKFCWNTKCLLEQAVKNIIMSKMNIKQIVPSSDTILKIIPN